MEKSENGNGLFKDREINGDLKVSKPRLPFSTRLTLALFCMLATGNFMLQRLTINFGLVCMVKSPLLMGISDNATNTTAAILQDLLIDPTDLLEENEIFNSNSNLSSLNNNISISTTSAEELHCKLMRPIRNGNDSNNSRFDEGEFEWSRETQGAILASFYYGFVFSQIPGGWFSDRFGAKKGLILSGLFLSCLSLLIPLSAHLGPEYIFTLRLLQGVFNGAAMPAISTLSSRWFPDLERGLMLGIAYAGFGIAAAITYPISAFFCEHFGWPYIFYFAGSAGLLWCICSLFLIYDWPENHPRITNKELQFIQKHRAVQYGGSKREKLEIPWIQMVLSLPVWSLLIVNFCVFWLFLTMGMYLPTYLKEVLYLDISQNGLLSALPFACMMIFHFFAAICFDRIRRRNLCSVTVLRKIFNTFGTFTAAASMIGIGWISCDNIIGAILLITMGQIFIEFAFMGGYVFSIFELAPKLAGTLTALMNTFGLAVGFISPALVSYLTPNGSREEWILVFYISAAFCIFGGVFYLLFGSSELQPWASGGNGSGGRGSPLKGNSNPPIPDKEIKLLKIRLINGESNINGEKC